MKTGFDELPEIVQKEILENILCWEDRVSREPGEHNLAPFQAMLISLAKLSAEAAREEVLKLALEEADEEDELIAEHIRQAYQERFGA